MELGMQGGETAFQGEKCCKMMIFSKVGNKRSAGLGYCIEAFKVSVGRKHGLFVIIVS